MLLLNLNLIVSLKKSIAYGYRYLPGLLGQFQMSRFILHSLLSAKLALNLYQTCHCYLVADLLSDDLWTELPTDDNSQSVNLGLYLI